jgi:hypothetical protein
VHNRGEEDAPLHLLPQLWFRNTWSWGYDPARPRLSANETGCLVIEHQTLGGYHCHFEGEPDLLFCDNDTNVRRLYGSEAEGYFKDAFHEYLVGGDSLSVNPQQNGTKAAGHYRFIVAAQGSIEVRLRLTYRDVLIPRVQDAQERGSSTCQGGDQPPFADFASVLQQRRDEADAFYAELQRDLPDVEARAIQRQALAGMIWNKQFYYIDIPQWLDGDPGQPPPPSGRGRNSEWRHLNNADIISMPDKWEYPWYAAWDLAFHCIALAQIDPAFAKNQLLLMTRVWYMHPNGQLPAYEWEFGDVNPPVHAWAVWEVYKAERDATGGAGDLEFLERSLHKLLLNFTWWVNRKDAAGLNVFQGGFLGLDNIGVAATSTRPTAPAGWRCTPST